MCRRRNVKVRKEISEYILRMNWTSNLLQRIPLKRILLGAEVNTLLPRPLRDVLVCRKLVHPIGRTVFNFPVAAKTLQKDEPGDNCPCRLLFAEKFRQQGGCVLTGHLDIVRNPELRRLLAFGARFRATPILVNPIRALEDAIVGENGLQQQIEKEYDPTDGAAMAKIAE